jgi:hypothetical protein
MTTKGLRAILLTLPVLLLTMGLGNPAWSDETDPSGSALRNYVESYLDTAPQNDGLANKIQAAGGINAWGINEWLCSLEAATTLSVGYRIWDARMRSDAYYMAHFTKSQFIPLNITNYCIIYSNTCDHWTWDQTCIQRQYRK